MKELISIGRAARMLSCCQATVKHMEKRGVLTGFRDYKGWRFFDPEEVEKTRVRRMTPSRQVAIERSPSPVKDDGQG